MYLVRLFPKKAFFFPTILHKNSKLLKTSITLNISILFSSQTFYFIYVTETVRQKHPDEREELKEISYQNFLVCHVAKSCAPCYLIHNIVVWCKKKIEHAFSVKNIQSVFQKNTNYTPFLRLQILFKIFFVIGPYFFSFETLLPHNLHQNKL